MEDCNDLSYAQIHWPERKIYKLSEMWKVWLRDIHDGSIFGGTTLFLTKKEAYHRMKKFDSCEIIAITRSNATEFYEGEGLD